MRLRILAATTVALALVGLSGCGQATAASLTQVHDFTAYGGKAPASGKASSTGPVAVDVWAKALATLTTCKSVRIDGTGPYGDKQTATMNLAGTCDGSNGRMQLAIEGQSLEVLTVSGIFYVKANAAFWRASGATTATINAIGTKYLSTTDPKMAGSTVAGIVAEIKESGAAGNSADVTVESTTMGGQAAYKLVVGARTSTMSVTAWVTIHDATPLRVKVDDASGSMDMVFSDWGAVAPFTAPPPAQTVKI